MTTIWKYPLKVTDEQAVMMPRDARILTIQTQYDQPCLWAWVDNEKNLESRKIRIYGTGHPMAREAIEYIGTFQIHGGSLVFHVFEKL
jgi:hypothetical protein